MKILVLNGPNLNLVGQREPGVYGTESYASICEAIRARAESLGMQADCDQTNSEGGLIDRCTPRAASMTALCSTPGRIRITAMRSATPLRRFSCRWWRCICPTSTPVRNSGIPR